MSRSSQTKTKTANAVSKARDAYLKRTYGISLRQYDSLLKAQKDCCAVCGKHKSKEKRNFSVDHDHKTGEIRGLLCNFCNRYVVGRHRDATLLHNSGRYLTPPFTGWIVPPKKKKRRKKK